MNSLKNSVQLIGRLGQDPMVRTFDSGKNQTSFSIAVNEAFYNSEGERVEDTQWFDVVAWGKAAENAAKLLSKGSQIAVNGKLRGRSYETKEGDKRYVIEVLMNEFLMLDSKPEGEQG